MTVDDANKVRNFKRLCTYRKLAELWYDPNHPLHGNQLAGQDLCRDACEALGIDWMRSYEFGQDPEFDELNKSHFPGKLGTGENYYWWE